MKTLECSHATGEHDESCDLVAGLNKEIAEMRQRLKVAEGETISARCHRIRYQCCDFCEDLNCGDNTSPAARRVRRLEEEIAGLTASAEGRLRVLLDKAEEAKREWARAENAEGQISKALSLLKPACAEENLEGAIRNLQQLLVAEQAHTAKLEAELASFRVYTAHVEDDNRDLAWQVPELRRCLSCERCSVCGRLYSDDPGEGMCCCLADHVEAHAAISGKVG